MMTRKLNHFEKEELKGEVGKNRWGQSDQMCLSILHMNLSPDHRYPIPHPTRLDCIRDSQSLLRCRLSLHTQTHWLYKYNKFDFFINLEYFY